MNKERLKRTASLLGKMLGLLGLLFVLYKLQKEYTIDTFFSHFSTVLPLIPLLLLINLISSLIGIYAWHLMLINYASKSFEYLVSYYFFAQTEIAKYLPGNIFHFIGRQALASKIGLAQRQMAKISTFFSFLLLVATVHSSTFFAWFSPDIPFYILTLISVSSMIILIITAYVYPSFSFRKKVTMDLLLSVSITLQGLIVGILIFTQNTSLTTGVFFEIVSIYIISWLVGFVTPGASGGLGVREGAFITIASFIHLPIASSSIVFSVLLIRLVNILVDMIMYLSTLILKHKLKGWES